MVAILILNWNGYKDTIECLDSLNQMIYEDYFIVVGDNGSTNDSLSKIKNHCLSQGYIYFDEIQTDSKLPVNRAIYLCDLKSNTGFAIGNNTLLRIASHFAPGYFLLLNNDTAVEPDFLKKLVDFHSMNPYFKFLTPLILYYYDKNTIWSSGGWLKLGFQKGFYDGKSRKEIKNRKGYKECSFITGCALFFTADMLNDSFKILSEDFFYGEEDFELSIRNKRNKTRMACVLDSIIYHKVSASSKSNPRLSMIFIHYLNRYIDIRRNYSPIFYYTWKLFNNTHLRYLLKKRGVPQATIDIFMKKLLIESKTKNNVTKDYFENIIRSEIFN